MGSHVLLNVILHGQKEKHCPTQVQAQVFKNENNSGCRQVHWDLKARW
jgi:hypothetical protein